MVLVALANAERPTLTHRLSLAYPASVTTERVGINGTERVGIEEVTLTLAHAVAIDAGSLVLLNVDRFAVLADLDDGRRGAVGPVQKRNAHANNGIGLPFGLGGENAVGKASGLYV